MKIESIENNVEAGARNLLLNCADARAGNRVLLVGEDCQNPCYEPELCSEVSRIAESLGMKTDIVLAEVPPDAGNFPGSVSKAMLTADITIFFSRLGDRVRFLEGDFVELVAADAVSQARLVTLDRVVCCYPDMERLIAASIAKCTKWFAVSYPSERWYSRLDAAYANFKRARKGDPFRSFVHSESRMDEIIRLAGLRRSFYKKTWMWRVAIYVREGVDLTL